MKKRILFIFLFLVMLFSIVHLYLNNVLLPVKVKGLIIKTVEQFMQRTCSIEGIGYTLGKGITLNNVKIAQKKPPQKPLISINHLSFNVFLFPLLKDKIAVIPKLQISGVHIFLKRESPQNWNISDIIKYIRNQSLHEGQKDQSQYSIVCKSLNITNANIISIDDSYGKTKIERIENINIRINLALQGKADFLLSALARKHDARIKAQGSYLLAQKDIFLDLNFENIPISHYLELFRLPSMTTFHNALLSSKNLHIDFNAKKLHLSGELKADNFHIETPENNTFLADTLSISQADLIQKENKWIGAFDVSMQNASLLAAEGLKAAGNLSTKIASMSLSDDTLLLEGDIKPSRVNIHINNLDLAGLAQSSRFRLQHTEGAISLEGNLSLKESQMRFNDKYTYSGNLDINNLALSSSDEITVKGAVHSEFAKITVPDKRSFSGSFTTTSTRLELNEPSLKLQTDLSSPKATLIISPEKQFNGGIDLKKLTLNLKENNLSALCQGTIKGADIRYDDYIFNGYSSVDLSVDYDLNQNKLKEITGKTSLKDVTAQGIPFVKEVSKADGTILFDQNSVRTQDFALSTGTADYKLMADVKDLSNPRINAKLSSENIAIQEIAAYFPEIQKKYPITLKGAISAQAHYTGLLKEFSPQKIHMLTSLKKINLESGQWNWLKDINDITGQITYTDQRIEWKAVDLIYLDKKYTLEGAIENLSNPRITAKVKGEKLQASGDLNLYPGSVTINQLSAKTSTSSINSSGRVLLSQEGSPEFHLQNRFSLSLKELLPYWPDQQHQQWLATLSMEGFIDGDLDIKGIAKEYQDYMIILKARSALIRLKGYKLKNNQIRYEQTGKRSTLNWQANLFDGDITASSAMHLFREDMPFTALTQARGLDLKAFRKDQKLKLSQLSGKLNMQADIKGALTDLTRIRGQGTLQIQEGFLGEIAFVEGLIKTINNVPGFLGKILSQSSSLPADAATSTKNYIIGASGDFRLQDQAISTENLMLLGSLYDLKVQGGISFDQSINALVFPDYSRFLKKDKTATEILGSPIHLRISGTLKHPRYKPIIDPVKPIENAVGTTLELFKGMGNILEEMF